MGRRDGPWRPSYRVLSSTTIWTGAFVLAVVATGSVWLLWDLAEGSSRLEVIKTAGSVVISTGGAAALLLAARRQRFVELDGTERRITDLQTKAADQLGSDKPSVRLAGLYALERLAQDNPSHRQTIVDIICGYLRMPYAPEPKHTTPTRISGTLRPRRAAWMRPRPATADSADADDHQRELQVRLAAQSIIVAHLQPHPSKRRRRATNPKFWPNIDINLSGACLVDIDLGACRIRHGNFSKAHFTGTTAWFNDATFTGKAWFDNTTFSARAWFGRTSFNDEAQFHGATFAKYVMFKETSFQEDAMFEWAIFLDYAGFGGATFHRDARFEEATFASTVWFGKVTFRKHARFSKAIFGRSLRYDDATFAEFPEFHGGKARTTSDTTGSVLPQGWKLGDAVAAPSSAPVGSASEWHALTLTDPDRRPSPSATDRWHLIKL